MSEPLAMQRLLMDLASSCINLPLSLADDAIRGALERMGSFVSADRVYVFDYDLERNETNNTYEWCATGIEPQIDELQHVPLDGIPDWISAHREGREMIVPDVSALPDGTLKELLEPQSIKSLLTVPMIHDEDLLGFVGFDSVRTHHAYTEDELNLLRLFAQILVNIRLRVESEAALRDREERLKLALIGSGAGLWDWDITAGRVAAGERWTEITGYSLAEIETMSFEVWRDMCHPEDREEMQRLLQVCLDGKTDDYACELRVRHGSGGWVWVLETGRVFERNADGTARRMTGTLTDITDRKVAEEAHRAAEERLRESEQRWKYALEGSGDGVWDWNPVTGATFFSPQWKAFFGFSPDEQIPGRVEEWEKRLHPDDKDAVFARAARHLSGETEQYASEHRMVRKDGSVLWVADRGMVVERDLDGNPTRMIGTIRDITSRREAEDALRDSHARLEAANLELARAGKLKDEFLSTMSHELRTPLNAVLALSEALLEGVRGPLNERQQAALRTIESSGRHLLQLITDILDFSRVETGRLELEIETMQVAEVARAALAFVGEAARDKEIQLSLRLDDQYAEIEADPKRLRQMLVNLLSNAVTFTPAGGRVILEAEVDDEIVHLTVKDTGIGIARDEIERIFQPFTQLDASLSRQHGGTGMGLALVRRLADLHGGSVFVESEVGTGSRFTISLPMKQHAAARRPEVARAETPPSSPTVPSPSVGRRILLAEDNEFNIEAIGEYLEDLGFEVTIARDGREAIEAARASWPDLILMDIQMPEMDGLEATRRLRAMPEFETLPIVALTGLAMPGDRERCLAAGLTDYLTKPVSPKAMVELIRKLLQASPEETLR